MVKLLSGVVLVVVVLVVMRSAGLGLHHRKGAGVEAVMMMMIMISVIVVVMENMEAGTGTVDRNLMVVIRSRVAGSDARRRIQEIPSRTAVLVGHVIVFLHFNGEYRSPRN